MIDTNDPDGTIKFCDELIEDAGGIPEAGEDFAASVIEKTESMRDWIDAESRVTERMAEALGNMRRGVDRWLGRDR